MNTNEILAVIATQPGALDRADLRAYLVAHYAKGMPLDLAERLATNHVAFLLDQDEPLLCQGFRVPGLVLTAAGREALAFGKAVA